MAVPAPWGAASQGRSSSLLLGSRVSQCPRSDLRSNVDRAGFTCRRPGPQTNLPAGPAQPVPSHYGPSALSPWKTGGSVLIPTIALLFLLCSGYPPCEEGMSRRSIAGKHEKERRSRFHRWHTPSRTPFRAGLWRWRGTTHRTACRAEGVSPSPPEPQEQPTRFRRHGAPVLTGPYRGTAQS